MLTYDDLYQLEDLPLSEIGVSTPKWIEQDLRCQDLAAILHSFDGHGGLESGVYMPAVEYWTAYQTMWHHGDDILEMLEKYYVPSLKPGESFREYACRIVCKAVERWAYQAQAMAHEPEEEVVAQ